MEYSKKIDAKWQKKWKEKEVYKYHINNKNKNLKMSQSRNTQSSLFNKNFFCPEIIQNSQALLRNKNNMELYSWETDGEEVHLIT